ncbi:hypothetical protein MMSR116_18110 [Methylobacterium mesophilicum SR1.6/6]|uniref:Uncharacterized protein n=1 Tax=Methylobacterium mesophilicum SR1.6/6 TaxID=908290 RepID=A0A6B9FNZ3_9HYPH|nr:hypothetical protein MMSR116_18110 [Methylobacterium mesophilicum SR1.6/6]
MRAEERGGPSGYSDRREAEVRAPVEAPVRAVGGELVPAEDFAVNTLPAILDTLVNPDAVAADASRDRLDLLKEAGALEVALDTADSMQAADSLERMLAHQLAATHVLAMKAAAVAGKQLDLAGKTYGSAGQAACVEGARLIGAAMRASSAYQAGLLTLQKVRSGGRQVVIVQHNRVEAGGQAVIGGHTGVSRRKRAGV